MIFNLVELGEGQDKYCKEERCAENGPPVRFPFRVKDRQPDHCGYPGFDISCTLWNETKLQLPIPLVINITNAFKINISDEFPLSGHGFGQLLYSSKNIPSLSVRNIDYLSRTIEVSDTDLCLLFNVLVSPYKNISSNFPFQLRSHGKNSTYTVFSCDLDSITSCILMAPSNREIQDFSYRKYLDCTKTYEIESVPDGIYMLSLKKYLGSNSFTTLTWSKPDCRYCEAKGKRCRLLRKDGADQQDRTECYHIFKARKGKPKLSSVITIGAFILFALVAVAKYYHLTLHKNDRENRMRIEKFLEDYIAFKPSRYAYADIKRITENFKNNLGQGAYGTVFKGKLSNDILVAVKILDNISKGNGEEFINEVATMGRIHHVNVVRLVGYCAEGLRRALVYEFLPNDSLEKYLSSTSNIEYRSLTWEMKENIALGIAKGIEYLHQGCDQRILHFDIKPHNILLDQNFTPKISDFGLAKLCLKDQSVVSMSTARGTMGYIAPEVFSRNFGSVSYKSDVYSFGILLLEMIGGKKNTDVTKDDVSEIYYPDWTYDLLEGRDLQFYIEKEEDAKIAKKLAIVGHWCIQWHPVGRPTMKVVVQMLEGKEELTMPPNPFASIGPSRKRSKTPAAKNMALELEVISE